MKANKKKGSNKEIQCFEKTLEVQYSLLRFSNDDIDYLKKEYFSNRKFQGVSGKIDLIDMSLKSSLKDGYDGLMVLKMRLQTNDFIADFEAPYVASAIIEKFDEKKILGRVSSSRVDSV